MRSRLTDAPRGRDCAGIPVVHEDDRIIVVDKPPGLLSQPGVRVHDSVSVRIAAARPDAARVALVHRLDMDTSGVLVLAKDADAHRELGRQFERRLVTKRYRAVLEGAPTAAGGLVALALRSDLDDRPRQIVDAVRGRASVTRWYRCGPVGSREIVFLPLTGRSHQLRVHAADRRGLGSPILGDALYGTRGREQRLHLHAERLDFLHPDDGRPCTVRAPTPFAAEPADPCGAAARPPRPAR